ncbi:MAG: hypothetical protein IKF82_08505 [Bacilli bacterium]|nr:hypothetical protein [Bacilli bacterium]
MCKISCMNVDDSIISDLEGKIKNSELLSEEEAFYFLSYVSFKIRSLLSDYMHVDIR